MKRFNLVWVIYNIQLSFESIFIIVYFLWRDSIWFILSHHLFTYTLSLPLSLSPHTHIYTPYLSIRRPNVIFLEIYLITPPPSNSCLSPCSHLSLSHTSLSMYLTFYILTPRYSHHHFPIIPSISITLSLFPHFVSYTPHTINFFLSTTCMSPSPN